MGIAKYMRLRKYKVTCVILAILSGLAGFIAVQSPAAGYEVSIYTSTPIAVWVLIIINIITCIALLINEASREGTDKRWLFPLGILVANGVIVLSLSVLRGYYTIGSDTLVHMGYVKDLSNGILSSQNNYPVIHIIPAILVRMGLSARTAANIVPALCYLTYVTSFYWLAKYIWKSNKKIIIATTLSTALLLNCGIGLKGVLVAVSIAPLTMLLVLRLRNEFTIRRGVAFLAILAVISYLHALALEVAIIALIVACIYSAQNRFRFILFTAVALLMVFVLNVYLYELVPTLPSAGEVALLPAEGVASTPVGEAVNGGGFSLYSFKELMETTQTAGDFGVLSLILRRYGSEILIGLLAIISLMVMASKYVRGLCRNKIYIYFGSLFIILNMLWVIGWGLQVWFWQSGLYNTYFRIACAVVLVRLLYWIPFCSIIIATPLLAKLMSARKLRRSLMVIVIVVMSVSTLFNVYPSPIVGVVSSQITHQHVGSIVWLLENGNPDNKIIHLNTYRPNRFVAALYGVEWCWDNRIAYWFHGYEPPRDFSYNNSSSMGYEYPCDIYLIVTKMDKSFARWEKDKLHLLGSDPATTLIYKDGDEIEIWFVESYAEQEGAL